jgi:putative methionine-R-sulfoxide reductase with GAF domain
VNEPAIEIAEILERGGDADDALRQVVSALAARPDVSWAGIAFVEEDALRLGPVAGDEDETSRVRAEVSFQDGRVGELWVDGTLPRSALNPVAALIAPLVLIGWDTGGEAWEP